jgi:LmbE family N-acetylglucosaminyl deacetylase
MTPRRLSALVLVLVSSLLAAGPSSSEVNLGSSPLSPPTAGTLETLDRALAKLSTHKRLLVIAAHPDDEDTSLLTLVSRGLGGEAAYLSMSRGDGGQNLIGPELGVGLGLLRSRELLAARGLDGGRQFFTRAYDFGYTLSLDETLRLWPKEVLLEDTVRVIRRFKPQVVVSIFPGVPHKNHGQHQAAGVAAYGAFPLAGDPKAFPELATAEGLSPWTPSALYRSTWFDRDAKSIVLPLGGVDPWEGKSYYQIAMASRSMHRSQDMGRLQELGPQDTRVGWVQGGAGAEAADLFAGIDTSLAAIAAPMADAERRRHVAGHLEAVQVLAERARGALSPRQPAVIVPQLLEILSHLHQVHGFFADKTLPEERPVAELVDEKLAVASAALAAAAGIGVDATTESEALIAGDTFPVDAVLWNTGPLEIKRASLALVPAAQWGTGPLAGDAQAVAAGGLAKWSLKPMVPAGAPPTVPYFLEKPLRGSQYDWSGARPEERGEPFGPPALVARFVVEIDQIPSLSFVIEREVAHRHRDQAVGEVRRPLRVVPRVEVAPEQDLLVWPVGRKESRPLGVKLTSHAAVPVHGHLELAGPPGWPAAAQVPFEIAAAPGPEGESAELSLALAPPARFVPGRYPLTVTAVLDDGARFSSAVPLIDYPHVRPTPRPREATVEVSAADLALPRLSRVGYVRGAADRVPEFLRQAGVPVEVLGPHELTAGDLSGFDAIVIGSRAYESDPALAQANPRLLEYTRAGGLLIVQYQQYPFVDGGFAPLKIEIARPHDRVTDETAAVTLLDPAHPVFNTPNRIGPEDWKGWIQERGLYFAHTWDPAFVPLLSMADPEGPEQRGSLLVAPLGKGRYVYTGLALFRQLPAGVPGAYRLFANLLALGRPAANRGAAR